MDACEIPVRDEWIVIPIWAAPFGVSRVHWKLPASVLHIKGVAFTLSEYEGEFSQQRIGELSLLANNKLSHPLNFDVLFEPQVKRLDKKELALSQPIRKASRISGYYKNCTDKEHVVKVYIHCISRI